MQRREENEILEITWWSHCSCDRFLPICRSTRTMLLSSLQLKDLIAHWENQPLFKMLPDLYQVLSILIKQMNKPFVCGPLQYFHSDAKGALFSFCSSICCKMQSRSITSEQPWSNLILQFGFQKISIVSIVFHFSAEDNSRNWNHDAAGCSTAVFWICSGLVLSSWHVTSGSWQKHCHCCHCLRNSIDR